MAKMAKIDYCGTCKTRHNNRYMRVRFLGLRVNADDLIEAAREAECLPKRRTVGWARFDTESLTKRQAMRILYELRRNWIVGG